VLGQRASSVAPNILAVQLGQAGRQLVIDAVSSGSLELVATAKYLQTSALVPVDVDLAPQPITVKYVGKPQARTYFGMLSHHLILPRGYSSTCDPRHD
jgi:hypothetical protein